MRARTHKHTHRHTIWLTFCHLPESSHSNPLTNHQSQQHPLAAHLQASRAFHALTLLPELPFPLSSGLIPTPKAAFHPRNVSEPQFSRLLSHVTISSRLLSGDLDITHLASLTNISSQFPASLRKWLPGYPTAQQTVFF